MLSIEIQPDGGVRITGSQRDLTELSTWLRLAVRDGSARATFVADRALTAIDVTRDGGAETTRD
jgi:hypothetical protein